MANFKRTSLAALLLGATFAAAQMPSAGTSAQAGKTMAGNAGNGATSMGGNSAAEASIQKMEDELTAAYKAKDGAPFTKYLDEDILVIVPGAKEMGKTAVIKGITSNPCTVNSILNSDYSYRWINQDTVMVTYAGKEDAVCDGKPMPPAEYSSSVWVRKNGNWVSTFHQSTPMAPMSPPQG